MRKFLILSCNTGQGHNSCAQALKEDIEAQGDVCAIQDTLAFISKEFSEFVCTWFVRLYRHAPGFWKKGYAFSEKHAGLMKDAAKVFHALLRGGDKLLACIQEGDYDVVICTHDFSAIMLTQVLDKCPPDLRTAFVATDYTCYPGIEQSRLDYYFVPAQSVAQIYASRFAPGTKIFPSGIPVRRSIRQGEDPFRAREKLGIGQNQKHLLVMCGSMGCGPMEKVVSLLSTAKPEDMIVTVVCGTNQPLYEKLQREFRTQPTMNILGYTDQISAYMDAADLLLTKPGGLSVSEALVKGLPMVLIDAVAGCEEYNMAFLTGNRAAVADSDPKKLAAECLDILYDENRLQEMRTQLEKLRIVNSAEIILQTLSEKFQQAEEKQSEEKHAEGEH